MYFIKDGQTLFRFVQWADLEDYAGVSKERSSRSLPAAIAKVFPNCEFAAFYGAYSKGWITKDGEPKDGFKKGNLWDGRERRNYCLANFISQESSTRFLAYHSHLVMIFHLQICL